MIILDTNVISALMHVPPDPAVVAWLDQQPALSVWTTAITVFEVRLGLSLLPLGRRRERLEGEFAQVVMTDLDGRILPFDEAAAREAGDLAARRQQRGVNIDTRDTQIAGIVLAHRATPATRNRRHFADLGLPPVDPWSA